MRKIKQNKTKYKRCNKSGHFCFETEQARKTETFRLFRRQKKKYLKKRWERKIYTNLKTDSYINKNITSIYYKEGIKEKRGRSVVNFSRPKTV